MTTTTTTGGSSEEPIESSGSNMKLNAKWTFWFDNKKLAKSESLDWKENLRYCGTFDDVETFWRIFNNLKPAGQIPQQSNYHLFRDGIEPMWEDPANVNGGKFLLTMSKKDSKGGFGNERWLVTCLAIIGETLDIDGDQICGAVVSIRKTEDRIALWLKSSEKGVCKQIGVRWREAMKLEDEVSIKFQTHKDAASSGRSFRNTTQFSV